MANQPPEVKNWPPKRIRPNFDPISISGQILAPTNQEVKFCPAILRPIKRANSAPKNKKRQLLTVFTETEVNHEDTEPLRMDAYMDDLTPTIADAEVDMEDILSILEGIPEEQPQTKSKSPRRKTYGAMLNDLRMEVLNLKQEIELRDAYIFSILHELTRK